MDGEDVCVSLALTMYCERGLWYITGDARVNAGPVRVVVTADEVEAVFTAIAPAVQVSILATEYHILRGDCIGISITGATLTECERVLVCGTLAKSPRVYYVYGQD